MSDKLKLSNQICFPFYALSRKVIKLYTPLLKDLDLTYPQYLVMILLWEKDGILIKDICEKLYLETNTISPLLNNLEKKWYIIKEKKNWNNKDTFIFLSKIWIENKSKAEKIPEQLLKNYDFDKNYLINLHKNLWDLVAMLDEKK